MIQASLIVGYTALFLWVINRNALYRLKDIHPIWLTLAFIAKIGAGCFIGWLYYGYYADATTADTIKFFNDGNLLFSTIHHHPRHFLMMLTGIGGKSAELTPYYEQMSAWLNKDVLFNDNKTIIRLNAFFRFFSLGNYYVHVVFINFISFTGLICLYRTFESHLRGKGGSLFLALMFYPSLLIWGSGLLKDGLLLFALGVLLFTFDRVLSGNRKRIYLVCLAGSLFLLLFTKFYVIAAILPGLTAWLLLKNADRKWTMPGFMLVYLVFLLIAFNLYRLNPGWNLSDMIYWKQKNFLMQADLTHAGSKIQIPELGLGAWSILTNAPGALLRALVRPGLFDDLSNPMVLMAAIENTLLLLFVAYLLFLRREQPAARPEPITAFSLLTTIVLLTLIGLITPILGALVRYKVVALPFLAYLVLRYSKPPSFLSISKK
ncbi:MAG: hypothetical protein ACKO1U_05765 [Bacteroidota bacterium]